MSKSISGGLGAVNLTIQELRLLNGSFTSLEAVNATISGTLTVSNISLSGNFISVNLTSSGTITGNDIVITGTMTYKGQDIDVRFVTLTQLNTALTNYVLTSALTTALSDYVLTSSLNTTLSDYVLTSALNTTLSDYVLTSALTTTLSNYVDISSAQSITGVKTFTANTNIEQITMDTGTIFNHTSDVYMGFLGRVANYATVIGYNLAFWNDGHIRFQSAANTGFRFYVTGTEVLQLTSSQLDCKNNLLCGAEITYKSQTLDARFVQATSLISDYVTIATAQTITGVKTFNDNIIIGNPTTNLIQVNRIKMDLPLIAGSSGNEFPLVLWNKDNANNEKQLANASALFYDAFNGTIHTPSLKITTATTTSVDAYYSVLIRDSSGQILTDTELVFNTSNNYLKSRNLYIENNVTFADEDSNAIATDDVEYQMMSRNPNNKRLRYSTNATINGNIGNDNARMTIHSIQTESITLNNLPLNYTQRLHTASYGTSLVLSSVYSWGNGYYIKPLVTQGDAIQTYGANLMAVSMTTTGIMSLLSADYEGAWEIDIALTFKNTNASSPRANPYIEIHKNNAYSKRFSTSAQYSRCTQAMHATLNIKGVDLIESTDTFKIVTKITTGSEQSYGTTVVTDWIGTNLAITWKYLGVMGEYTHAITS